MSSKITSDELAELCKGRPDLRRHVAPQLVSHVTPQSGEPLPKPRRKQNSPEGDLVKAVLTWLELMGIFAWRNNTGAFAATEKGKRRFVRFGLKGSSDILGVLPGGRLLAIECKSPTGKVRPEQQDFIDRVTKAGGLAFVTKSIEEVQWRVTAAQIAGGKYKFLKTSSDDFAAQKQAEIDLEDRRGG